TGTVLDEPFPGVLVPPGTEIEELDFEDEFIGYEWHHPRMPPSRRHDYQALRKLGAALVERLAPTLPSGFSLASYWTELICCAEPKSSRRSTSAGRSTATTRRSPAGCGTYWTSCRTR